MGQSTAARTSFMAAAAEAARPVRILELRSVRGTGGGPEKTILLGTARTNRERFEITVCYVRDLRDTIFRMGERARELGISYTEVLERHSFDLGIWAQLRELVRERRIDIVHSHDYKTDMIAWLLARWTPIVPMATVHGWISNSWRERVYNHMDTLLLRTFPAVVAVSGPIRARLIARGAAGHRVHRIPNGVDQEAFRRLPALRAAARRQFGFTEADFVIGQIGRLEDEKRPDLLLETAARLPFPSRILIVGDGSRRSALVSQARELGLGDRVVMTGLRADVPELLHAMDVYVQTSDTEGVPNVVLEAMATEVPVVATDVGGTAELIGHGVHGLLVPKGDVTGLAAAVARTRSEPGETGRRVRQARQRIELELSFAARMSRVEEIYVDLTQRRSGADSRA